MTIDISRVIRSKSKARNNYNKLSSWYDIFAGRSEEKYREFGLQMLDVKPGERVLEIGIGTGHSMVAISRVAGSDGSVVGIDISDGMVHVTQRRLRSVGLTDEVGLSVADGVRLPSQSQVFDAVFMSFTLELFDTPEIPEVLSECFRVLMTDGRVSIVSLAKSEKPGYPERIYEWVHKKSPVLVDCRPIMADLALKQAGFRINLCKLESMWGLPVNIIGASKQTC